MATDPPSERQDGGTYGSETAAEAWQRGAASRAQALGPLTEMMFDLAGVGPGSRVLDVAAGTGEQTLLAPRRVGPTGSVLATDIASSMLEVAAEGAREAGLTNVETRVMDARSLDLEPESFERSHLPPGPDVYPGARAGADRNPPGLEAGREAGGHRVLVTHEELIHRVAARHRPPPPGPDARAPRGPWALRAGRSRTPPRCLRASRFTGCGRPSEDGLAAVPFSGRGRAIPPGFAPGSREARSRPARRRAGCVPAEDA